MTENIKPTNAYASINLLKEFFVKKLNIQSKIIVK